MMRRAAGLVAALALSALCGAGCGGDAKVDAGAEQGIPEAGRTKGAGELRVMSLNLGDWAMRARGGAEKEGKAAGERAALTALVAAVDPDVLLVQEVGGADAWEELRLELEGAGLAYRHGEHLTIPGEELHQGVLSRVPIAERNPHTEDRYTIGPRKFVVKHGILDVTLDAWGKRVRLLGVDLKDKEYNDFGQTEMRRNEARLLNNRVRDALKGDPDAVVLVAGCFHDTPDSAAMDEVMKYQYKGETLLSDVRPVDVQGNAWTGRGAFDTCERVDYVLGSKAAMSALVREGTYIPLGSAAAGAASRHRGLVATIRVGE